MKLKNTLAILVVVLSTVACGGKIPSAYQGNFEDKAAGVKLTLADSNATMSFADGHTLTGNAADLNYDDLLAAKSGLYTKPDSTNSSQADLFWLNPNVASKQAQDTIVWYTSEVVYTLLNTQAKDKVPNIQFFHCLNGQVMLDSAAKTFQLGCPAGPDTYNTIRVGN